MTPYEAAVNEVSAKLALEDLSLLIKRDVLHEQAKEAVRNHFYIGLNQDQLCALKEMRTNQQRESIQLIHLEKAY